MSSDCIKELRAFCDEPGWRLIVQRSGHCFVFSYEEIIK